MSTPEKEFENLRDFVRWIGLQIKKYSNSPNEQSRLFVGYDLISWRLRAAIGSVENCPEWASSSFPLQSALAEAGNIWGSTHEQHLCLFFRHDLYVHHIIVAVRNGLWRFLDDRFLPHKKEGFVEISDDEMKKLFGASKAWTGMCGEAQMFGIGCRVILRQGLSKEETISDTDKHR